MLWQDSGLAFILRLKPQMMVNGYHMFLLQFTVSSSFIFFWSDVWFLLLEWLLDGLAGFLTDLFIKKNLGNNEARYQRYKVCFNVFLVACSYSVWNFFIFSFLLLFFEGLELLFSLLVIQSSFTISGVTKHKMSDSCTLYLCTLPI